MTCELELGTKNLSSKAGRKRVIALAKFFDSNDDDGNSSVALSLLSLTNTTALLFSACQEGEMKMGAETKLVPNSGA